MRHLRPWIALALLIVLGGLAGCRGRSIQEVGRSIDPCPPDACGIRWVEPIHDPCGGDPRVGAGGTGAFARR